MIEDARIQLIKDINQVLTSSGKPQLSTPDFDILIEMDIDELNEVMLEITQSLKAQLINQV